MKHSQVLGELSVFTNKVHLPHILGTTRPILCLCTPATTFFSFCLKISFLFFYFSVCVIMCYMSNFLNIFIAV